MKIINTIWRGCHDHPGTRLLLILIFMGAVAGRAGGLRGALVGACIMAVVFTPMYLYGAYYGGKIMLRESNQTRPSTGQTQEQK